MTSRGLISAAVLCAVSLVFTSPMDAQTTGAYKRIKVIEEFTSTTCGPCALAAPALNAVTDISKDVVSIRYHVPIPVAGDPWYAMNPVDVDGRMAAYGVNSAPFILIGGKTQLGITGDLNTNIANLSAALNSVPPTSFVRVTVTQSGPKIIVKVKADRALTNATLQFFTVTRSMQWNTVPGTNGEKAFEDIMLKMYPDSKGTTLSLAANEEKTFEFTPKLGTGTEWGGKQYFTAFVQDNAGEILQAGVTQTSTTPPDYSYPAASAATSTVTGGKYLRVDRDAQSTSTLVVSNPSSTSVTIDLTVDNVDALAQAGMAVSIAPSTLTIPAGGTANAVTTVTGPDRSIYVSISRSFSASDGLGRIIEPVNYLVNGAKAVNYYGLDMWHSPLAQLAAQSSGVYGKDVVYLPFATDVLVNYPMTDFGAAIIGFDYFKRTEMRGNVLAYIEDMLKARKGIWVQSQLSMYTAYLEYPTNAAFDTQRQWYSAVVGIEHVNSLARCQQNANGQVTGLVPFPVKGVAADPIGDGITFSGNGGYSQQAHPYFVWASDMIKLKTGSKAKSVLYCDNDQSHISMIRVEPTYGGRLVYSTVGLEAISTESVRTKLTENVINWLLDAKATVPAITVSASTLNFGNVAVDADKPMTFVVTNTGNAELVITALNLTGTDAASFYVSSGGIIGISPIKVAAGATHTIEVTFSPVVAKNIFGAALNFVSNATTPPVVQLRGSSSVTGVETEVVSETGAIGLTLVGSNPVTDFSSLRISGKGNISVSVVDASGRTVSSLFDGVVNGTETVGITSSTLVSGTYSIVGSNGADRAVLTVVVVR